jgi:hypothetical protein
MKSILSEKNLVVILFVMVLVTFSFAQEDSKKMTKLYSGFGPGATAGLLGEVSANSLKDNDWIKIIHPSEE